MSDTLNNLLNSARVRYYKSLSYIELGIILLGLNRVLYLIIGEILCYFKTLNFLLNNILYMDNVKFVPKIKELVTAY